MTYEGGCHCGQLRVSFTTAHAPTDLPLRACQCTFCRRHGGLTTSDPDGEIVLTVAEVPPGGWYRFGTGVTDFWVCARCGVYVGAYVEVDGQGQGGGEHPGARRRARVHARARRPWTTARRRATAASSAAAGCGARRASVSARGRSLAGDAPRRLPR